MGIPEIASLLAAIGVIVGAILTYRVNMKKAKSDMMLSGINAEAGFRKDLLDRINQLEEDAEHLNNERSAQWAKAEQDRKALIADYDTKIDNLSREMRRKSDETMVELSTWRDRYWTLYKDYETLRIEHMSLEARFTAQQRELDLLKAKYLAPKTEA